MTIAHTLKTLVFATVMAALLLGAGTVPAAPVEVQVQDRGIALIRWNGITFSENDFGYGILVSWVNLTDADGKTSSGDNSPNTRTLDADGRGFKHTFDWGEAGLRVTPAEDRLNIDVTLKNSSSSTIHTMHLNLGNITFPAAPPEYDGNIPHLQTNMRGPSVVYMTFGSGSFAFTNEDVVKPLLMGFPWALNRPTSTRFPMLLTLGRNSMYPTSIEWIDRPLGPGESDSFSLAIRFAAPIKPKAEMVRDLYEEYFQQFPGMLEWPDRRPLGADFVSEFTKASATNPRGYLWDGTINVFTPEGRERLNEGFLKRADTVIANLQAVDAQGVIVWDVEGQEFPHAFTYIGNPPAAPVISPEIMAAIAGYFSKIRVAGFRVGVTLRPQTFGFGAELPSSCSDQKAPYGDVFVHSSAPLGQRHKHCSAPGVWSVSTGKWQQEIRASEAMYQILLEKARFAYDHWQTTLFYVDSNGGPYNAIDPVLFQRLVQQLQLDYPEAKFLFVPEHEYPAYHRWTAPYKDTRVEWAHTPAAAGDFHESPFSVIAIYHPAFDAKWDTLISARRAGDVFIVHPWYTNKQNDQIKAIYAEALLEDVAPITANLPAGLYNDPIAVSLTTSTPGARIYYTVNGAAYPTEAASLYQEPILLTDLSTLRARAFKGGMARSRLLDLQYQIAKTPGAPGSLIVTELYPTGATD